MLVICSCNDWKIQCPDDSNITELEMLVTSWGGVEPRSDGYVTLPRYISVKQKVGHINFLDQSFSNRFLLLSCADSEITKSSLSHFRYRYRYSPPTRLAGLVRPPLTPPSTPVTPSRLTGSPTTTPRLAWLVRPVSVAHLADSDHKGDFSDNDSDEDDDWGPGIATIRRPNNHPTVKSEIVEVVI